MDSFEPARAGAEGGQEEKHQAFPYFIRSAIAQLQYSADDIDAEGSDEA